MEKKIISKLIKSYRKEENKYILTVSKDVLFNLQYILQEKMPFELFCRIDEEVIRKMFANYKKIKFSLSEETVSALHETLDDCWKHKYSMEDATIKQIDYSIKQLTKELTEYNRITLNCYWDDNTCQYIHEYAGTYLDYITKHTHHRCLGQDIEIELPF